MAEQQPGFGNIAATIYRELRRQILHGELAPGERLPGERELAQRYDTNRNTLREAVRMLEQARLVTVRHGQGVTVADFRGHKIINYRCSPVVFATNGGARYGCGAKGDEEFECGGVMTFPGNPIAVCGTNVN